MTQRRKTQSISKPLARAGDPLILPNGQEVSPEPLPGEEEIPHSTGIDTRRFRPVKKRTLKEMPTSTTMLNAIACVFMYTIMGVGDREIALALKITPAELQTIRKHHAYKDCFENVLDEFISANSSLLQARIASYGAEAVDNIMGLAKEGKKEETRLRANIDIADRAGITAKQNQKAVLNDLHITITKGDEQEVKISMGQSV